MSNYAYPSAKLRVLENKILNETDIERMIDAADLDTSFKVLHDTDYADDLLEVAPHEYRLALHQDNHDEFELLKKLTPDENLLRVMFINRDFFNLKALFKEKYHGINASAMMNDDAIYDWRILKKYVTEGVDEGLDPLFREMIDRVGEWFEKNHKPYTIDNTLTQEYFAWILAAAKRTRNAFIIEMVKIQIDNANILSVLRSKRMEHLNINLSKKLIPGGDIDTETLVSVFGQEIKSLRPIVAGRYDKNVVKAFDAYLEKNLLFDVEKSLENYLTEQGRQAKMVAYGPEVIFAYHLAKQIAVGNIRIIMTGKWNNIPAEEIKKTIRNVY